MTRDEAKGIISKAMKLKPNEITQEQIKLNEEIIAKYGYEFFQSESRLHALRNNL